MSTRSVTYIHEIDSLGQEIVCGFYRHSDGYPSGHGQDLADWLKGKKVVNGIGGDFNKSYMFNRCGTMSVQLCAHIQEISGCEMIFQKDYDAGQDHDYHVFYMNDNFYIKVDHLDPVCVDEFDGEKIESILYED